ncbi:DUF935 domain-containing protein [Algicola sagamiensis]|uniref:DUF935 domain-containing protein n=1 Tax=Algicola sagamiensis TaxID=163869 RepID=UPI0003772040|nr:DUF935 domain-containing protein [Algicola sagamiensis]
MTKLTKEIAAPTHIRNVWGPGLVASGLTPARLASILREADEGSLDAYLTLAEEMEERDPHYSSVLRTRKLAVASLEPIVESIGEDPQSEKLAQSVRDMIATPQFADMLTDALDALGKGFSALEIIWDKQSQHWQPKEYKWRDPRFFAFSQENPEELRLLDEVDPVNGIPLPQYKFIVHRPKLKSGLTLRGGLARLVAFAYLCKMYGKKDWLAFIEVYGLPLRVGKYGSAASKEDIDIVKTAVANIGSDAAAVLPDSMQIEFHQVAQAANGAEVFARLVEWIDQQVSKAVLGQTMTSDNGSSLAQAKVHNEVRQDIIESDAKQLANTINRDLIRPFIDINFGPQKVYPKVVLRLPESEDLELLASNLEKLVPLGLKVDATEVRAKLGLSEPTKDSETLGVAQAQDIASNHQQCTCGKVLNRAQADEFSELMLDDWEVQMNPIIEPVIEAVAQADDYAPLLQKLPQLLSQMNPEQITSALSQAGFVGYVEGVEGEDETN